MAALGVGLGFDRCVWSGLLGVGGYIHKCVSHELLAARDCDGVCSPHGSLTWEQVAVAKSFSRHLYFDDLTFITLLDLC